MPQSHIIDVKNMLTRNFFLHILFTNVTLILGSYVVKNSNSIKYFFLYFSHLNVLRTACPIHARIGVRNVYNPCAVRGKMDQNKREVVLHMERKHTEQDQEDHCADCGKVTNDLRKHAITDHRP